MVVNIDQDSVKLNIDGVSDEKTEAYAGKLMKLARDTLTVRFRFFNSAISGLKVKSVPGLYGFACDGDTFSYDPAFLLMTYLDEPHVAVRAYLHGLLHMIFMHMHRAAALYGGSGANAAAPGQTDAEVKEERAKLFDMACDIAVEHVILDMNLSDAALSRDSAERDTIGKISKWVSRLNAEAIYKEFLVNPPSEDARREYTKLFTVDSHHLWRQQPPDELIITEEQWKKIAERVKTDVDTFSKEKSRPLSLEENLHEAVKQRYDYKEILKRFVTVGEELKVNDDEFDYVYYTYGLRTYGNLPLIEALEYKEEELIRDFVIVIDTSASTRGEIVENFLRQTYEILLNSESFFTKVRIHIIMSDSAVRSDEVISNREDFEAYMKRLVIKGYGGTDFRPAFAYVDELIKKRELENLKGLIYFTDGYGVYPAERPDYETIFAFLYDDENAPPVPQWAIKVVVEES